MAVFLCEGQNLCGEELVVWHGIPNALVQPAVLRPMPMQACWQLIVWCSDGRLYGSTLTHGASMDIPLSSPE